MISSDLLKEGPAEADANGLQGESLHLLLHACGVPLRPSCSCVALASCTVGRG